MGIEAKAAGGNTSGPDKAGLYLLLGLAGIVHGIFVSGGPLLIGYLTKRIQGQGQLQGHHFHGMGGSQHHHPAG